MAFCEKCGHEIKATEKFCPACGNAVGSANTQSTDFRLSLSVILRAEPERFTPVKVWFAHLNKTIVVNVPNYITIGKELRLRGLGYTSADGQKGDAYITIAHIEREQPKQEPRTDQRRIRFEGEICKCPNCGDILDAYEAICESCGYERRGVNATSSIQELAKKLQAIESQRPKKKSSSVFKQVIENNNNILSNTDQQKIDLIKNFPIPNTKEDIYEFLFLASSNINPAIYRMHADPLPPAEKALSDAWYAKFEQAYKKAHAAFGAQRDFENITALYNRMRSEIHAARKSKTTAILAITLGSILFIFLTFSGMFAISASDNKKIAEENSRIEEIVEDVYEALEEGNYILARAKASTISYTGPTSSEGRASKEKWDQVKAELLEIIDEAEQAQAQKTN